MVIGRNSRLAIRSGDGVITLKPAAQIHIRAALGAKRLERFMSRVFTNRALLYLAHHAPLSIRAHVNILAYRQAIARANLII